MGRLVAVWVCLCLAVTPVVAAPSAVVSKKSDIAPFSHLMKDMVHVVVSPPDGQIELSRKAMHSEVCHSKSWQTFREIGEKLHTIASHTPLGKALQKFVVDRPDIGYGFLKLPGFLNATTKMLTSPKRNHQYDTQILLQYVDDQSITEEAFCPIFLAMLGFTSMVFTSFFVIKNTWFFDGTMPHEVSLADITDTHYGLWATVFSVMFSLVAGLCHKNVESSCRAQKLYAASAIYPSILMTLWGMTVSAANWARHTRAGPEVAERMPRQKPNSVYGWHLNTAKSQIAQEQGKSIKETKEAQVGSYNSKENQDYVKVVESTAIHVNVTDASTYTTSLRVFLMFFSNSLIPMVGLLGAVLSFWVAAANCDLLET